MNWKLVVFPGQEIKKMVIIFKLMLFVYMYNVLERLLETDFKAALLFLFILEKHILQERIIIITV